MLRPHGAWSEGFGSAARVGVLAGTFDPLTVAHTALAEAALADGCELVVLVVPERSVGKEDRADHAGRIRALVRRFEDDAAIAVAGSGAGLYVDIAAEAAETFPSAAVDLVCGADKVRQILDPSFYDEPVAAVLSRLFDRARLLVAPRGDIEVPRDPRIVMLDFRADMGDVSSTKVRAMRAGGHDVGHLLG